MSWFIYKVICVEVRPYWEGGPKTRNVDTACRGRCPFQAVPPPLFQMLPQPMLSCDVLSITCLSQQWLLSTDLLNNVCIAYTARNATDLLQVVELVNFTSLMQVVNKFQQVCWLHQDAANLWKSDLLQLDICRLSASCWNNLHQACG